MVHSKLFDSIRQLQTYDDIECVLNTICRSLPNAFATITFRDSDNTTSLDQEILTYTTLEGISEQNVEIYDEQFQSNDSMAITERELSKLSNATLGRDQFDSFLDNLPQKSILNSEFYNEFLLPLGVNDSVILDLFPAGFRKVRLNIYFDSTEKTKANFISDLNELALQIKYALSFAYFNDDDFRELIRFKTIQSLICQRYKGVTFSQAKTLYLWGTKPGTRDYVALNNGYGSPNTFRNAKKKASETIFEVSDGNKILTSQDSIIRFINEIEKEIQSTRLLEICSSH